jgi:hypothetical protein
MIRRNSLGRQGALFVPALVLLLVGTLKQDRSAGPAQDAEQQHSTPNSATFYRDVLPILQERCQICHRSSGIAPTRFETYEQTRPYAAAIAAATLDKSMPPWFADPHIGHFSNDPSLSAEQIALLAAWAADGALAGNSHDAPTARHWAESWSIAQADLILKMPKGVPLTASGDVEYTYEIVPTGFKEDRWVQAVELLPSLRANVHHAVVYVRPPDSKWMRHAPVGVPFTSSTLTDPEDRSGAHWTDSDVLLVYAPGSSPDNWPDTMAKLIPAGSDLVFQMHYTTNGHAAEDATSVGLVFSKHTPRLRVLTLQLANDHDPVPIPPNADNYRVEVHGTIPNDATLLSFFPHMHLRGKKFEYNVVHPDHSVETLLRVNYDFFWQLSYRLAEPRALKAGTELQAIGWYDNSSKNLHNPDPNSPVTWGDQTSNEMMVGFFDVAVPAKVDKHQFFVRSATR